MPNGPSTSAYEEQLAKRKQEILNYKEGKAHNLERQAMLAAEMKEQGDSFNMPPRGDPIEREYKRIKQEQARQKELEDAQKRNKKYDPYMELRRRTEGHGVDHDVTESTPNELVPPEPIVDLALWNKSFTHVKGESFTNLIVYAFSSVECPLCEERLFSDFMRAAEYHAEEEWVLPRERRQLQYGYIDVSKHPDFWAEFQKTHPHNEKWQLPCLVAVHPVETHDHNLYDWAHSQGEHAMHLTIRHSHVQDEAVSTESKNAVSDDGVSDEDLRGETQAYKDMMHYMGRIRHKQRFGFSDEEDLHHMLYSIPHDGVLVALMWDPDRIMRERDSVATWYREVRDDESMHIHFAAFEDANLRRSSDDTSPLADNEWVKKYNPNDAEILAFIVDENDPESFEVEEFVFKPKEADDYEEESYRFHHALRHWIDQIKLHRHKKSNRRFHGVMKRHVIHKAGVPKERCTRPILKNDTVTAKIIGSETHSGREFLRWEGAVVAGEPIGHMPPYMHDFMLGFCAYSSHEVYSPEHEGFHAEHYHIEIYGVITTHDKHLEQLAREGDQTRLGPGEMYPTYQEEALPPNPPNEQEDAANVEGGDL